MMNLSTNYTFTDVFDNVVDFVAEYKASGLYTEINTISDENLSLTFYLLYARYGNSAISNSDVHQFEYKLFSTIFMYGPAWAKKLEIQSKLRNLSDEDIQLGIKQIYNHSYNPSTEPSTNTLNELPTINEQNVTKSVRGQLDSYSALLNLIETDVTNEYISKFKNLFMTIGFDSPDIFVTEVKEEEK